MPAVVMIDEICKKRRKKRVQLRGEDQTRSGNRLQYLHRLEGRLDSHVTV